MLKKRELLKIKNRLKDRFGLELDDCQYFIGDKYVKIFNGSYVIHYNREHSHIEKIYNIDYHLHDKSKLHYINNQYNYRKCRS